jgi:predicted transglutaminase-like cysteine proteinase
MRILRSTIAALGIAALLASPAWAQRGRGMFGPAGLLTNKSVQEELKLDDQQKEKAKELAEQTGAKMREAFEAAQSLEGQERREKMMELMKPINEELNKSITTLFKPEQNKRFQQISLQQRGIQAFSAPEVQTDLKLTDAQKEKIKSINEETGKKLQEIRNDNQGDFAAIMEKSGPVRKEALEKVVSELNDDQKKAWKEKLGAPFEIKYEPPAAN